MTAEKYWKEALELNQIIGNLDQEGYILINYGIFFQDKNLYELAIENWNKAKSIFGVLGISNEMTLAIGNMGEVYLQTCDYQSAFDNLTKAAELFYQMKNRDEQLNTLFVLGRFWFVIGESEELEKILNQYEYFLLTDEMKSEKNDFNYRFLKFLMKLKVDNFFDIKAELSSILEASITISENDLYTESILLSAEQFLKLGKFDEALSFLSDNNFIKFIEHNIIFKAQREYLLGKIAYFKQSESLKSPLEYFETAYNLIEDESITELTWKILFTIAETYWERGNFHKAKKPSYYSYELINMIGENISNSKIRSAYFNHPERKKALEKLIIISKQTQLNEFQKS